MENALLLDAAEYFDNPDLSDVTITIREEVPSVENSAADAMDTDAAAGNQQQQGQIQPGHKVLLSSCSSLYKSMVSDACGAGVSCSVLLLFSNAHCVTLRYCCDGRTRQRSGPSASPAATCICSYEQTCNVPAKKKVVIIAVPAPNIPDQPATSNQQHCILGMFWLNIGLCCCAAHHPVLAACALV
jgi:hypothetical protein